MAMNMARIFAMHRKNTSSEPLVLRAFDKFGVPLMWLASAMLGISVIAQIAIAIGRHFHAGL